MYRTRAQFVGLRIVVALCGSAVLGSAVGGFAATPPVAPARPFGAAEAARRQDDTAKALGAPKEAILNLGVPKGAVSHEPVTMKLVLISAGEFLMGSPDEERAAIQASKAPDWLKQDAQHDAPRHRVTITRPFYIGTTEVTQQQYEAITGKNPSKFLGADRPVHWVTWDEAVEFCRQLSARTGRTVGLPTEAQWEYACRAGSQTPFCFGDRLEELHLYANYRDVSCTEGTHEKDTAHNDGHDKTAPVGSYKPNAWGLYDMHGNVWEWCADWFADSYANAKAVDPSGPDSGISHVLRGGSWAYASECCRSTHRVGRDLAFRSVGSGFRVVMALPGRAPVVRTDAMPKEMSLDLGAGVKAEVVLIPAGTFLMGSPDNEPGRDPAREGPLHEVTITKPFYMGKYEVTVAQFRRFVESTKYVTEAEQAGNKGRGWDNGFKELTNVSWKQLNFPQEDNQPVGLITWKDAKALVAWAANATGKTVRLPTEAEWEYACRAQTTTRFNLGNDDQDLDKAGWFEANSGQKSHPVGQKAPNAWGLYDMHGNLWEWCEDRAQKDYYKESPRTDPPGPSAGNGRLLRGGSWHDPPANCRSARRGLTVASPRFATHGFRIMVVCDDASASARVEKPARADFAPLAFATNLPREAALDLGGGVKMGLVLVPAGEFMMGAPRKRQWEGQGNEAPLHRVTITKPFYIGKYEVTVAQFAAFVGATKYQTYCEKPGNKGGGIRNGKWAEWPGINWRNPGFEQTPEHPVVLVSWNDAQAFVAWLSKQAGREVRLPTEAQWEYAARGPKSLEYPFGNKWDGLRVNHADAALKNSGWQFGGCSNDNDGYAYTAPVGKFNNASWCGAFDMVGNVGEVVQDWEADYPAEAQVDPQGAATGQLRVKRSSNWADHAETPASYRERKPVDGGSATNGFRVMVVALESPTATTSPPQATRTWTDSTGKHRMEATLLDFDGKVVRLKRPDGKIVTVPLEKLSETDRKHVRPQTRD